ncbi:hypothetical protein BST81_11805 [Leptolyngbya sp. 'hensonii']|uniref:WD40 repeat domain-containing protein n=1 Tax=Leptolyngbya sp. 'hensonii' TaxID=1922337 RepID=UPI00094FF6A0|nr:WD40 repeat domain-containing protein [Leptolyngbya sp. 'hensonii']OLP18236.1 hypothetical protein BST81_11805 [Leptolyngbya sp. 'hensonii']
MNVDRPSPDSAATPRNFDAVLGGETTAAIGSVVLGGFAGVQRRFAIADVGQRLAAVQEAIRYGQMGVELLILALQDESPVVQRAAYRLLRDRSEPIVHQALKSFNVYPLFTGLQTLKGGGMPAALSPDGMTIAVAGNKTIKIWDLQAGDLLYTVARQSTREFFVLGSGGSLLVRSPAGDPQRAEIRQSGELEYFLYGHEAPIRALALSPDRQWVATGGDDRTIRIWDVQTGKPVWTIGSALTQGTHRGTIAGLVFTPDHQTLISSSIDSTLKFWNLRTRERPRTLKVQGDVRSLVVSQDGRWLAGSCWRKIFLWNLATGQLTQTLEGHAANVWCLSFSPDGKVLASCDSYHPEIKLWAVKTGRIVHSLVGHEGIVSCLSFTAEGQRLVSCGADKKIRFWGVGDA